MVMPPLNLHLSLRKPVLLKLNSLQAQAPCQGIIRLEPGNLLIGMTLLILELIM